MNPIMCAMPLDTMIRHPRIEDAQEITELISLCDIDDHGVPDITLDDLLHMWKIISMESNAWVVCDPSSKIIGYAFLDQRGIDRMDTCVYVHPHFKNQGIGSLLLTLVEERAHLLVQASNNVTQFMNHVPFTNLSARSLVESRGFTFTRLYKRMKMELSEQPSAPSVPDGITVRTFQPDLDEGALYELYDQTFRDTWGYTQVPREEWITQQKGQPYDPSLWFIVWAEEVPVAFLLGRMQEDGFFIDRFGVKREWRNQGIGQSLLLHAFYVAYLRGQRTFLLYVDSNSLTNAHQLYERVGMQPDCQMALYCKELHAV